MQSKFYHKKQKHKNTKCSHCGVETRGNYTFEQVISGGFDNTSGGSYDVVRETPVRGATFESDFLVPACQSLMTAVVATAPAVVVSLWFRWEWYSPIIVGTVTVAVSWLRALEFHRNALMKSEKFSYYGDEPGGENKTVAHKGDAIKLEVVTTDGIAHASMKIVDLPDAVSGYEFSQFCKGVLSGKSLARKNWTPLCNGFSREVYDELLIAMEDCGLVFKGSNKAKVMTNGGKRAIQRMIQEAE